MGKFDSDIERIKELTHKVLNYEEELRSFREAIASSSEGIALLTEDGVYTFVNESHAAMFGYTIEEMLGNTWMMLYPEEDVQYFLKEVFPIIAEKGTWSGTAIARKKDGSPIKESLTLKALSDGGLVCHCRPYDMLFNTQD
jgi:PAS domain S-box-containing protein